MHFVRSYMPIILLVLFFSAACGGSNDDFEGQATVIGRASAPSSGVDSSADTPLANATVTVVADRVNRISRNTVEDGNTTDADGNYRASLPAGGGAIVVHGTVGGNTVRISGLVRQQSINAEKNLNTSTDVAYQAYTDAVEDGSLQSGDLTQNRIQNLENAARDFLNENEVDFFDPASVSRAASAVRESVGISGASSTEEPSSTATPTPTVSAENTCEVTTTQVTCPSQECSSYRCDDGFVIGSNTLTCADTGQPPTICVSFSCPLGAPNECIASDCSLSTVESTTTCSQ